MPQQEKGIRAACALPYELQAEGQLSDDRQSFRIVMEAGNKLFGTAAAGAPFQVYAPGKYRNETTRVWDYTVAAGGHLSGAWPLDDFENKAYHLRVYGPNGFFREFRGDAKDPLLRVSCQYQRNGNLAFNIENRDTQQPCTVTIKSHAYNHPPITKTLAPGAKALVTMNLARSFSWYDCSVQVKGYEHFEKRYAGHVETGKPSRTDPLMGQVDV